MIAAIFGIVNLLDISPRQMSTYWTFSTSNRCERLTAARD